MKNTHKIYSLIVTLIMAIGLFSTYIALGERAEPILMNEVLDNNLVYIGVRNIVMTVYLNYRLFDTLFEAMLLLICVMGVLQFSELSPKENRFIENVRRMNESEGFSSLMTDGLRSVYPFILILGLYVIISGINSPGGGFQGGAIIAAISMSLHLSTGRSLITVDRSIILEKVMFIILLIISLIFLKFGQGLNATMYRIYLITINVIIGVKVYSGFVILYLQFMHSGKRYLTKRER